MKKTVLFLLAPNPKMLRQQEDTIRRYLDDCGVGHRDAVVIELVGSLRQPNPAVTRLEALVVAGEVETLACLDVSRLWQDSTPILRLMTSITFSGGKVITVDDQFDRAFWHAGMTSPDFFAFRTMDRHSKTMQIGLRRRARAGLAARAPRLGSRQLFCHYIRYSRR